VILKQGQFLQDRVFRFSFCGLRDWRWTEFRIRTKQGGDTGVEGFTWSEFAKIVVQRNKDLTMG